MYLGPKRLEVRTRLKSNTSGPPGSPLVAQASPVTQGRHVDVPSRLPGGLHDHVLPTLGEESDETVVDTSSSSGPLLLPVPQVGTVGGPRERVTLGHLGVGRSATPHDHTPAFCPGATQK